MFNEHPIRLVEVIWAVRNPEVADYADYHLFFFQWKPWRLTWLDRGLKIEGTLYPTDELRHLFKAASQKFSDRESVVRVILFQLTKTQFGIVLHLLVISIAPLESTEYQIDVMIPSPPVAGS
jgi:hypothetical protein